MASSTRNASVLINGNNSAFAGTTSATIRDYSDFSDTVDLTNNVVTSYHTRMLGGADNVTLSNINIGGFSNKINGNLGDDTIKSKVGSLTRDFILGGSESDLIDLSNSLSGADWQNGNRGNDKIIGANSEVMSILRGGSENDTIIINANTKHIAVGDLGTDVINLQGLGRVVCRTDNGAATKLASEADLIINFTGGNNNLFDKAYIPGVKSVADLSVEQIGTTTYLKSSNFTNGSTGDLYIAGFADRTKAQIVGYINDKSIIAGSTADAALAALNPTSFLNDFTLGGLFS